MTTTRNTNKADTIYRDLVDAYEALELARYLDANPDTPALISTRQSENYVPISTRGIVTQIDIAIAALHVARDKAVTAHLRIMETFSQ